MSDDQEIGSAKKRALGEIVFGLSKIPFVKIECEQLFFGLKCLDIVVDIVVDEISVVSKKQQRFGKCLLESLVEFSLIHHKTPLEFLVNSE